MKHKIAIRSLKTKFVAMIKSYSELEKFYSIIFVLAIAVVLLAL